MRFFRLLASLAFMLMIARMDAFAQNTQGNADQTQSANSSPILAQAKIETNLPGIRIPPDFLGLSHEWGAAQSMIGEPPYLNKSYIQLLKNLTSFGNGPFILRIGGNSTDFTKAATPQTVAPFAALHKAIGVRFILGVNLGADDPKLAEEQARTYAQNMPGGSIIGFEIGNEPDLYHSNGHRGHSYSYQDYINDFTLFREQIMQDPKTKNIKVVGPAWAMLGSLKHLPEFLEAEKGYLALVTQHWYPNNVCGHRPPPPASYLLTEAPAASGPNAVRHWVKVARQYHLDFRMGEMNSFACGGALGVSDRFVSALWAIDAMFRFADEGVSGVNFHSGNGGNYAVFSFLHDKNNPESSYTPYVRPLYYGLYFFARAIANHSSTVPVEEQTTANIKVYATKSGGKVRVAILNKETDTAGDVALSLPKGYHHASLIRLLAPDYKAATGITLGGQTFDGSMDGKPVGKLQRETVKGKNGEYKIHMPAASAALVTFTR